MSLDYAVAKRASSAVPLHGPLADRWSPRGFDPTHALTDGQITALLEAARWAPSATNSQPWRFAVARRGDALFGTLHDALAPGNQVWADAASALILIAARTHDDAGAPLPWATYDTGQAAAALSVQAHVEGLHVHQMGGFDADVVRSALQLPTTIRPMVIMAVGQLDENAALPEPLAERERAERVRLPIAELLLPLE